MTDKIYTIDEIKQIVFPIAKKYGVEKVYLFGSYARGEATEKSDIDLRVTASNIHSLFVLGGLYSDLEEALNKSLDLVTTESLINVANKRFSEKFYENIKTEEKLLYEN